MKLEVLYFAALRERAGIEREQVDTDAATLAELYAELAQRRGLGFPAAQLRVALDGEFVSWSSAPREGAELAFIPPVSGG